MKQPGTYANGFTLPEEWPDYGIGDPFVMRYNGRYYLYCSTKDYRPGIKAWSSSDLVHWDYAGLVTADKISTGAYAPEVVYWNGLFYLYTSPAGLGHYVYRSESPTGPFTRVTGNIGRCIDGSVFIDDDGSWYFYHAGDDGIVGHPMGDPLTPLNGEVLPGTFMGHWTEGPCMIRRNGVLFFTFTGNRVFSRGYRISYAVSDAGPLGPFTQPDNNPLLISTEPGFHGIGHSSTVLGPDLDSHWIVYHDLVGQSREGPPVRRMNIDRLAFSGRRMTILGPTRFPQPAPRMPDFVMAATVPGAALAGAVLPDPALGSPTLAGAVLADPALGGPPLAGAAVDLAVDASGAQGRTTGVFTAELNLSFAPEAAGASTGAVAPTRCGVVFSVEDAGSFEAAFVEPAINELVYVSLRGGTRGIEQRATLPAGLDFSRLHAIRVQREARRVTLCIDQLHVMSLPAEPSEGGGIGFLRRGVTARYGFTAFTNQAGGSSDRSACKPVPGGLECAHAVNAVGPFAEGPCRSAAVSLDAFAAGLSYRVNVERAGRYQVSALVLFPTGRSAATAAIALEALVDGEPAARLALPSPAEGDAGGWHPVRMGSIELPAGLHDLTVRLVSGPDGARQGVLIESFTFYRAAEVPAALSRLERDLSAWDRDGEWVLDSRGLRATEIAKEGAKCYWGDTAWTDYTLEADVTVEGQDAGRPFGVLARCSMESSMQDQVPDSFFGYYLELTGGTASIHRIKYDRRALLGSCRMEIRAGMPLHVSMRVTDSRIDATISAGSVECVIRAWDPVGLPTGRIGLYTHEPGVVFSNVAVRPAGGEVHE